MVKLNESGDGVSFKVKVQPKASKNEICGQIGDSVKIRLTAPPVDGAANEALVQFLAKTFKVAKGRVEIVSGHTGRNKIIKISGVSVNEIEKVLK